jgi:hypothetical protein
MTGGADLGLAHLRAARPTDDLEAVARFYRDGLGLEVLAPPAAPSRRPLPRNVKVLALASLLNDTASEMIYPLLPHFLLTALLGNRFALGVIEGVADAVARFGPL